MRGEGGGKKVANELKLGFCGNININFNAARLARILLSLRRIMRRSGQRLLLVRGEEDIDEEY